MTDTEASYRLAMMPDAILEALANHSDLLTPSAATAVAQEVARRRRQMRDEADPRATARRPQSCRYCGRGFNPSDPQAHAVLTGHKPQR